MENLMGMLELAGIDIYTVGVDKAMLMKWLYMAAAVVIFLVLSFFTAIILVFKIKKLKKSIKMLEAHSKTAKAHKK